MPKFKILHQRSVNQLFICLSLAIIISVFYGCNSSSVQEDVIDKGVEILAKVEVRRSVVDYTLVLKSDSTTRSLAFYRNKDSTVYNHMNYQFYTDNEVLLKDELVLINILWDIAQDSIELNLTSLMIGYPLEYQDVLQNQILAFRDTPEWNDVREEDLFQNYGLMRGIMKSKRVYYPLDSLLETKGLVIQEFSTEKHGYVPKDELKKLGFDETLKIPVPFMVWIGVKQI